MEKLPIPFYLCFCKEQQVLMELHKAEFFAITSLLSVAAFSDHCSHLGTIVTSVIELYWIYKQSHIR